LTAYPKIALSTEDLKEPLFFLVLFFYIKKQTFETLISEEALLFAKYLRNEKTVWNPRTINLAL
jgi:hypothetical protein